MLSVVHKERTAFTSTSGWPSLLSHPFCTPPPSPWPIFFSSCAPVWFHPGNCTPWLLLAPVILINHETNKHRRKEQNQSRRRSGKPIYVNPPAVHIISPWHHLNHTASCLLLPSSPLLSLCEKEKFSRTGPKLLINVTSTHRNRTGNGTTGWLNDTILCQELTHRSDKPTTDRIRV